MPIISVFFEPAHFDVEHQGQQAKVDFDGRLLAGAIQSNTAMRLVREWAALHRDDLVSNWECMKAGRPLNRIPPLE